MAIPPRLVTRETVVSEYIFLCVAELGDLAVATHCFPRTDGNGDDNNDGDVIFVVVIVGADDDGDEGSPEREVHYVPTRRQLAGQRSRRELFRRPRNHLETARRHAQLHPMARFILT